MEAKEKVLENRLRRAALRQGLRLEKCKTRDARAIGYGTYRLVDEASNAIVAGGAIGGYGMTIEDVEKALNE